MTSTYTELTDERDTTHQWIVEPSYHGASVRYGTRSPYDGHWTHYGAVEFGTEAEAIAHCERHAARIVLADVERTDERCYIAAVVENARRVLAE